MIKAIFFDIDGTLLSFKTHEIPRSAINAINKVQQNGVKVFISTGRLLKQIPTIRGIEFDGFITVNGGYCVTNRNEVIFKQSIPKKELSDLIEYQKNVRRFSFSFMLQKGIFVNYADQNVIDLASLVKLPVPESRNLEELLDEDVMQINLYVNTVMEREIMDNILLSCESSRWNPIFADVNLKGIDKATGINKFLDYYNLNLSETMAFGDGGNDIRMLKHVAIGVAMGNAGKNVKQSADYITDSVDNDGIEKALKYFGLA